MKAMFDIKWLEERDYVELCQWWRDWNWTPPTRDMLPDDGKCGVMVSKDGVNICAGFLYQTNSKFSLIEFVISNKHYREKDRKEAIESMIKTLSDVAENSGQKHIFTSLKNQNLKRSFIECGFNEGDVGTVELIKNL